MSITRFTFTLVALMTTLALAPAAQAQLFKPFAFPPIESDFQFFSPADVDSFGGGPKSKTGWFATVDRVNMSVQRPEDAYNLSSMTGDFTWGNRFDIGFVDDDRKGWMITGWHIDGPNENDIVITERLSRFMSDASPQGPAIDPFRDNNLRLTGGRDYLVTNSVNDASIAGFELNRTWLWKPLHHGARLEPLVGFRYVRIVDFYRRDTYTRYDENGLPLPSLPSIVTATASSESLSSLQAETLNDLVGGQLGMHWAKDYRRWNFSGDVKGFVFQNFQNFSQKTLVETSSNNGTAASDTAPDSVFNQETGTGSNSSEFVFGMEVRVDAAYQVTRDVALRAGFEFMDFGQGIGRGINPAQNDQAMLLYGLTFGVTLNR